MLIWEKNGSILCDPNDEVLACGVCPCSVPVPASCPCTTWENDGWPCAGLQPVYTIELSGEEWSPLLPRPYRLLPTQIIAELDASCTWANPFPNATVELFHNGEWTPHQVGVSLYHVSPGFDLPAYWRIRVGQISAVSNFFVKTVGSTPVGVYTNINKSEFAFVS